MRIIRRPGFTLIELLLAISMMGILAGIGLPVYQSFQNRNDVELATMIFVQGVRRAQVLARGVDGDANWGMYVTTGTVTLYSGASYAARTTTLDETYDISSGTMITGTNEFNFSKFTGLPAAGGTVVFTSPNNETRTITINAKGTVSY